MAQQDFTAKVSADVSNFVRGMDTAQREAEDTTTDIEGIKKIASELTKEQVKLTLDATATDLQRKIDEVKQQLRILEESDPTVTVKADTDQAERKLRDLKGTGDISVGLNVDEGRVNTTSSAIKDIAQGLGSEAAGVVTDFSQAFNDIREQAVEAFGGPESAFGQAIGAIGPIATAALGAGVGGLLYLWNEVKKKQEEANKRVEEYYKLLKDNQGADQDAALRSKLLEEYDKLPNSTKAAFAEADLGLGDIVKLLKGEAVPKIDELKAKWDEVNRAVGLGSMDLEAEYVPRLEDGLGLTRDQAIELRKQLILYGEIDGYLNDQSTAFSKAKAEYQLYSQFIREDAKETARQVAEAAAATARSMGQSFLPSWATGGGATPTQNNTTIILTGGADPYSSLAGATNYATRNGTPRPV